MNKGMEKEGRGRQDTVPSHNRTMILCKLLLLLCVLGLAARYASMRAPPEFVQTSHKILWWCGRVVDVGKLKGVCSQVVQLLNAPLVFYVLAATIGKDARVSGSLTSLFRLMGLQQDSTPPVGVGGGPCEEGLQGAPVDVAWGLYAR